MSEPRLQDGVLSYTTQKIFNLIELQMHDLENTIHYLQKKHTPNQIK